MLYLLSPVLVYSQRKPYPGLTEWQWPWRSLVWAHELVFKWELCFKFHISVSTFTELNPVFPYISDARGNRITLNDQKDCGYYINKGKDGKTHLIYQLHSHCHQSVEASIDSNLTLWTWPFAHMTIPIHLLTLVLMFSATRVKCMSLVSSTSLKMDKRRLSFPVRLWSRGPDRVGGMGFLSRWMFGLPKAVPLGLVVDISTVSDICAAAPQSATFTANTVSPVGLAP